ncbi:D-alanyl-D-alanine carboxypeptidase [Rhizobium tumorigenes]|uniref:D-alanyl-D-alanine carboxypeptidase n=1 Tax=Rhizobium tumorigenes TaxID=2041385 RepID=A0AAF1K8J6_9HYPH|nr:D-alanyl-D-alanine carboxypeptidase [Rhizobium tumorigenes]WFR96019.1 D-alanyl-D-alanine carboxypeptidase [Rhizobium tumorigenes]
MKKIWVALSAAVVLANSSIAAYAGSAYFIMDAKNGKVLASQSADELNHPASLTKMMTLYLAFEALHRGKLGWNSELKVSGNAAGKSPTKLGLRPGSTVTVREAVNGMIIKSANDAATVMAEALGGSESGFGRMMTAKARQLGMSRTTFVNPSGLPDPRQITTARDMSTLAVALINDYPTEYRLFSQTGFVYRGRPIRGHNNLMYRYKGMDGIKTGYTNASGFNIVSTVRDGNRRLIGVVLGGPTARARDDRMAGLLNRYMSQASSGGSSRLVASIGGRSNISRTPEVEVASASPDIDVPAPLAPRRTTVITRTVATATGLAVPIERPQAMQEIVNRAEAEDDAPSAEMTASTASSGGAWQVQIAATPSAKAAKDLLATAQAKTGGALLNAFAYTEEAGKGSKKVYRARFVGFESRAAADNACSALKKHDFKCMAMPG